MIARQDLDNETEWIINGDECFPKYNYVNLYRREHQEERDYSEEDFYSLPDKPGMRYELIGGKLYAMAAPSRVHQSIVGFVYRKLADYIDKKGGPCEVYMGPISARLTDVYSDGTPTIPEPDLMVVCDPAKLFKYGCDGAPDLILEVVSPGNPRHDYLEKLELYQRAGVREYWIADPKSKQVVVYWMQDDAFEMNPYSFRDTIPVRIHDDCSINFAELDDRL